MKSLTLLMLLPAFCFSQSGFVSGDSSVNKEANLFSSQLKAVMTPKKDTIPVIRCEKWKREALMWEQLYEMAEQCVMLMDFKSQEAKDAVIAIHKKMGALMKKEIQQHD